jgi:copper chaperone NosL
MKHEGTWRCEQHGVEQLEVEQPVPRLLGRDVTRTARSLGTGCATIALLAVVTVLTGCDSGPRPIRYGQDECAECKMTLVDRHYGAEFITARGRVYVFDDLNCLTAFERKQPSASGAGPRAVVVDFKRPNQLIPVESAWFLHHPDLRSPMASGLAAFGSEAELEPVRRELGGGRILRWSDVKALPP